MTLLGAIQPTVLSFKFVGILSGNRGTFPTLTHHYATLWPEWPLIFVSLTSNLFHYAHITRAIFTLIVGFMAFFSPKLEAGTARQWCWQRLGTQTSHVHVSMSRSMAKKKTKANNGHKIYMHSERIANISMTAKVCPTFSHDVGRAVCRSTHC